MSKIVYRDLPGELCGYYDNETGAVHIDRRLTRRAQRCTYEHELVHKILGHMPLASFAKHVAREIAVERLTARRMIAFPDLLRAAVEHDCETGAVADALDVDPDLVCARVMGLEPEEQLIFEVCARHCKGAVQGCPLLGLVRKPALAVA